jgi:hypothetical protein
VWKSFGLSLLSVSESKKSKIHKICNIQYSLLYSSSVTIQITRRRNIILSHESITNRELVVNITFTTKLCKITLNWTHSETYNSDWLVQYITNWTWWRIFSISYFYTTLWTLFTSIDVWFFTINSPTRISTEGAYHH